MLFPNPILYLPAYRRIEQDLSTLFPEMTASSEFRASMEHLMRRLQNANYMELVQFDMQDVEKLIQMKLHKDQQSIRDFVSVCNGYLYEKRLIYNDTRVEVTLEETNKTYKDVQSDTLPMSMLSSGEKQIISVFSRIYLLDSSNYFVIIDEPELSLSIFWQKRFLPDILNSGRCSGLVVVTHSPSICDNELDDYMRPLQLFMELTNDRP